MASINWCIHARHIRWAVIFIVQNAKMINAQVLNALGEHLVGCKRTDSIPVPRTNPLQDPLMQKTNVPTDGRPFDLNPIRANIAEAPETCDFTSHQISHSSGTEGKNPEATSAFPRKRKQGRQSKPYSIRDERLRRVGRVVDWSRPTR